MTANAMQGDRDKCGKAGMDHYLSKPIRPEELARIFAQWLPPQTPNESDSTEPMDIEPSLSNLKMPPAINVQTLKELEELGGHEFLQTMIQKFVDDALECVTFIEEASNSQDLGKVQETAYGLKGISRNMGADSLAELAFELENACKTGNENSFSSSCQSLQERFQQTRQALEATAKNS